MICTSNSILRACQVLVRMRQFSTSGSLHCLLSTLSFQPNSHCVPAMGKRHISAQLTKLSSCAILSLDISYISSIVLISGILLITCPQCGVFRSVGSFQHPGDGAKNPCCQVCLPISPPLIAQHARNNMNKRSCSSGVS